MVYIKDKILLIAVMNLSGLTFGLMISLLHVDSPLASKVLASILYLVRGQKPRRAKAP